jgi:protein tyrosine/serine phosphatase
MTSTLPGLIRKRTVGMVTAKAIIRVLKILAISTGLTAASAGAYLGAIQYEGNFHTVAPGALYRSGQLNKSQLYTLIGSNHIKSILNLRGAHPGDAWYDDELSMSTALGIKHYDYAISSGRMLTAKQIAELLSLVETAPKPLLVHCRAGADRSGLISALYRFVEEGASARDADRQLSLLYGHFPYLWSRTGAMDESFWAFVRSSHQPRHDEP